ncbi:MAG: PQQ-binding-like beta-propeller repeat protein [Verrucomicrobiales bacterium]|nr:PQQ-binding-like beta-propeller repeat protein [Verrucomicrobiales bacterium]
MIRYRQLLLSLLCLGRLSLEAADWPTHQANYARNAFTEESFPVERGMRLAWAWSSPQVPQPAWPQPAKWDSYKYIHGLKSMRNYDPVFHVTMGGGLAFFGSSVDDAVHALDLRTGEARWIFPTEGPVRVAPTLHGGRLYFGSDDGFAYCLDARTGSQLWKFSPQAAARRVLNGGKLISFWPVRTGVVVDGDIAYFAASMLPWKRSYLCAVDAVTGSTNGAGRYVREMDNQSIEGPFAASAKHLVMPQGRVAPRVYSRSNGEDRGALGGGGGSFVLLADDNQILHGPGNLTGRMVASQVASRTQLASFDQANAIVVVGAIAYVLTDTTLSAMKRSTREARWTVDCGYSFALIGAGETLFVGGTDAVAGYRMSDGKKIWSQPLSGRVYGLAAAAGHLVVSTDAGRIYSFVLGAATNPPPAAAVAALLPTADQVPVGRGWSPLSSWDAGIRKGEDANSSSAQDWIFHRAALHSGEEQSPLWPLRDGRIRSAGSSALDAQVTGIADVQRVGEVYALKLDGKQNAVRVDRGLSGLQSSWQQLSVDAWIQFDRLAGELAIVGVRGLESTNAADRGWRLGTREGRLVFGLACSRTNGWIEVIATAPCRSNTWHHVAGVYDGRQLRVYLDGESMGTRDFPGGEIVYPATPVYEMAKTKLGAKEVFLSGLLHRVRVQYSAAPSELIQARFNKERSRFHAGARLAAGPSLQFTSPTEAVVRWHTTVPSPTVLEYDLNGQGFRFENPALASAHEVRLTGLRYDRIYKYSVAVRVGEDLRSSREFECDTYFNYSPSVVGNGTPSGSEPGAHPRLADLDRRLKGARGIALVLGVEDGTYLDELCRMTEYRIIGFATNASSLAAVRQRLQTAGWYGSRVTLHLVSALDELPVPGHFANVLVSETMRRSSQLPAPALEILRLMKPGSGVALLGGASQSGSQASLVEGELRGAGVTIERLTESPGAWFRVVRDELVGAGDWTHQYGGADNSAFGGEALLGARNVDELEVQWLGEPGPRYQDDRNGRNAAPLAVKGRLFCQGLERVICVDAHNGSILWTVETPDFMRYNVPRDCANWCADQDSLYLAIRGQCWRIDQQTGRVEVRFPVAPGPHSDWNYDWGFLAREGDRLIGTGVKEGTAARDFWGGIGWYDAPGGEQAAKVCSDHLFSCDPRSGSVFWTYAKGLILNSTITTSKGRVYFLENRRSELLTGTNRWIHSPQLWDELRLVVLDAQSGEVLQEKPMQIVSGDAVVYLAEGQGKLVLVSSHQQTSSYYVYVRDSDSGELLWQTEFKWMNADHGGHMSRPAIVGNRLFIRPRVFDLHSGDEIPGLKMAGGGCGTYAASANALFFRSGNVSMWETDQSKQTSWARLRPDCWISTLPALGMVLSPEGGGGCSCGSWMETSAAFMPDRQQTQLLRALAGTGKSSRVQGLLELLSRSSSDTRLSAIRALGASRYREEAWEATPLLVRLATHGQEPDQVAARAVLRLLDSPKVNPLLLSFLEDADPMLRLEAIQALGDRGASQAMPQLLQAARDSDRRIRAAALRAIPQAALVRHYPAIIGLMGLAETSEDRQQVRQAVLLTSRRLSNATDRSEPLVTALTREKGAAARQEWIGLLGAMGSREGFAAVRSATQDQDVAVRDAAWSALEKWSSAEAFDPLLELAASTSDDTHRHQALAGAVRVLFSGSGKSAAELVKGHAQAMSLATTALQRRPVLDGLSRVGTVEALRLVEPSLDTPENRSDAAAALLHMAKSVGESHPDAAVAAMLKLRRVLGDSPLFTQAGETLDYLQRFEDFVKTWQVSEPFSRPAGNDDPLLSIEFQPEKEPSAQITWTTWTAEASPRGPTLLNLGQRYGATNACVYARMRVKAPAAMNVMLQIASDESYKLWLNGKLVREQVLEKPRRASSKSDRHPVELQPGWNDVLLKSVQTEGDWQLGCRIRGVDGTRIGIVMSGE